MDEYMGSLSNGIQSLEFHAAVRSLEFEKVDENIVEIDCDKIAQDIPELENAAI